MHYYRPDGNIPHDQTNQSPWWDAGATQPCSNTPFHSLSATNTWSPINGTPRAGERGSGSALAHRFMPDDFIITHPSVPPFSASLPISLHLSLALSIEQGDELSNNPLHAPQPCAAPPSSHLPCWLCLLRHAKDSQDMSPKKNPKIILSGKLFPGQELLLVFKSCQMQATCWGSILGRQRSLGLKDTRMNEMRGILILVSAMWRSGHIGLHTRRAEDATVQIFKH